MTRRRPLPMVARRRLNRLLSTARIAASAGAFEPERAEEAREDYAKAVRAMEDLLFRMHMDAVHAFEEGKLAGEGGSRG